MLNKWTAKTVYMAKASATVSSSPASSVRVPKSLFCRAAIPLALSSPTDGRENPKVVHSLHAKPPEHQC